MYQWANKSSREVVDAQGWLSCVDAACVGSTSPISTSADLPGSCYAGTFSLESFGSVTVSTDSSLNRQQEDHKLWLTNSRASTSGKTVKPDSKPEFQWIMIQYRSHWTIYSIREAESELYRLYATLNSSYKTAMIDSSLLESTSLWNPRANRNSVEFKPPRQDMCSYISYFTGKSELEIYAGK